MATKRSITYDHASQDRHVNESPCRRCQTMIPMDADACHSCGFDPKALHDGKRRAWGVLAGLSILSLVGIPIAPLFLYKAYRHGKEIRKGAAE